MKTKILIIALDGLEYTYIDQGNYPHIKQQEYGTVKVPVTEIDEASTPIIWSSFVTGEQPEIHGINRSNVYHSCIVDKTMKIVGLLIPNQLLRKVFIVITPIRKWFKQFDSFKTHQPRKEELKVPTMFEVIPSSVSVSVPVLDYDVDARYEGILEAIIKPKKRVDYVKFLMEDFEKDKRDMYAALNKYKLVMAHFHLPDLYGHIYCRDMEKIKELYHMLDVFISEIVNHIDDCWLLIISDHGIDKDFGHTNYGFYSSNTQLGLETPDITDFYKIIMGKCL